MNLNAKTGSQTPPAELADQFVHWMTDCALPTWHEAGWDSRRGGFYERLWPDGTPEEAAPRRVRVQARQIYVFALAHQRGWIDGKGLALKGFDYLVGKAAHGEQAGRWATVLNPDGAVADGSCDLYDHAFILLALSHLYAITQDSQVKSYLTDTYAFIEHELGHEKGGWHEAKPDRLPRRQNPHMHMFEAMLAMHDALGGKDYIQRASLIFSLLKQQWLQPSGGLGEYFDADWSRWTGERGGQTEPGHGFEWVWLLSRFHNRTGTAVSSEMDRLYSFARKYGLSRKTGMVVSTLEESGALINGASRTWQQTEFLKAAIVQTGRDHPDALDDTGNALSILFDRFISPAPEGCWIDAYHASGKIQNASIWASTLYHLLAAAMECARWTGLDMIGKSDISETGP